MTPRATILAAALLAAASTAIIIAGPLTPPPGAPAPTYKTLSEVEPRIPIASLPFSISTPGSYYLTANLNNPSASTDSIAVLTPNVTIDLNGFVLSGGRAAIAVNAGTAGGSVTVTNGTIRNANQGISATPSGSGGNIPIVIRDVRFRDIAGTAIITQQNALIERCTFRGFGSAVSTGPNSIIRDAIATQGSAVGYDAGPAAIVERSIASSIIQPSGGAAGIVLRPGATATNIIASNISAPSLGINTAVILETTSALRDSTILTSHYGVIATSAAHVDNVNFHAITGIGCTTSTSAAGTTIENSAFTAFDNHLGLSTATTGATIRNNILRGTTVNPNPNPNAGIGIGILPNATAAITGNIIGNINRSISLQSAGNTVHSNIFHLVASTISNFSVGSPPPAGNLLGPVLGTSGATTTQNPLVNLVF